MNIRLFMYFYQSQKLRSCQFFGKWSRKWFILLSVSNTIRPTTEQDVGQYWVSISTLVEDERRKRMKSHAKVATFLVNWLTNARSCKGYQLFQVHVLILSVGLYDKMHRDNTERKNCSRTPT